MHVVWVVKTKTPNDAVIDAKHTKGVTHNWVEIRLAHRGDELTLTMMPTDALRMVRQIVMAIAEHSIDDVFAGRDVIEDFAKLLAIADTKPSALDIAMRED